MPRKPAPPATDPDEVRERARAATAALAEHVSRSLRAGAATRIPTGRTRAVAHHVAASPDAVDLPDGRRAAPDPDDRRAVLVAARGGHAVVRVVDRPTALALRAAADARPGRRPGDG